MLRRLKQAINMLIAPKDWIEVNSSRVVHLGLNAPYLYEDDIHMLEVASKEAMRFTEEMKDAGTITEEDLSDETYMWMRIKGACSYIHELSKIEQAS